MINKTTKLEYQCKCVEGYYGNRCEYEEDICEDNKCENGALCLSFIASNFNNQTNTTTTITANDINYFVHLYKCECTSYFYGEHCETPYYSYLIVKNVSKTLGIASIVSLVSLYLYIFIMDFTKYYCKIGVQKNKKK